ncbi:MAG: hypothetical protein CMI30_00610 [Opitutae bacterium]|nr:hypothetical protein [Rhodospirillaceae bacterium]MBL61886.1 hypothetical protein [Opitutae bacterium]|tara:strand:+ start:396 stop:1052 length:657 start_codon:yes stop_codon:yes gene_type:complete
MKPNILACFAVEEEAKPFRKIARDYSAIQILITGIGRNNARKATLRAIEQTLPESVFTCGFAGGLNPAHSSGRVLYACDESFPYHDSLAEAGAISASFYCAERVLITADEKEIARDTTQADAVEMESGAIWEVCQKSSIPCCTLRVVSDAANETLPLDFNRTLSSDHTISHTALAKELLKNPGRIPELIRFRRQITGCAERLATVLARAVLPQIQSKP